MEPRHEIGRGNPTLLARFALDGQLSHPGAVTTAAIDRIMRDEIRAIVSVLDVAWDVTPQQWEAAGRTWRHPKLTGEEQAFIRGVKTLVSSADQPTNELLAIIDRLTGTTR